MDDLDKITFVAFKSKFADKRQEATRLEAVIASESELVISRHALHPFVQRNKAKP